MHAQLSLFHGAGCRATQELLPLPDRLSAVELAMNHESDGFVGRPAVAMMGYDQKGDRWEVLVVCHSAHGLIRRVRMMFGIDIEWDGDAPIEFDRLEMKRGT